jgi:hypothetical protein
MRRPAARQLDRARDQDLRDAALEVGAGLRRFRWSQAPERHSTRSHSALPRLRAEGDPRDLPQPPTWVAGWQLGTPDLMVTWPEPFTVPAGALIFRARSSSPSGQHHPVCERFEFRPGNSAVVHHANIRIDRTPASRRLDDADPAPGTRTAAAISGVPGRPFSRLDSRAGRTAPAKHSAWRLTPAPTSWWRSTSSPWQAGNGAALVDCFSAQSLLNGRQAR